MKNTLRLISILIILALVSLACLNFDLGFDPTEIGEQIEQVATSAAQVITESAPLRATSAKLVGTVITGGKTEMPPVLTQVSRALTMAAVQVKKSGSVLFEAPHSSYSVLENCRFGSYNCADDAAHTGQDSVAEPPAPDDLPVDILATGPGRVARIIFSRSGCVDNGGDCGFGNAVILEHTLADGTTLYSLYGHLDSISYDLVEGQCVPQGTPLGKMGASGYGQRDYWSKTHLHLEFKAAPVLGDPRSALSGPQTSPEGIFFGYINTTADPEPGHWGYYDPQTILGKLLVRACP